MIDYRNTEQVLRHLTGNRLTDEELKDLEAYVDMRVKRGIAEYKGKVKEVEKAYGGCHKCYGKGYATYRSADSGYGTDGDIGGYQGRYYRPWQEMRFCTCERGEQLKSLLEREHKVKSDEDS